jgi:hypothetical protein
LGQPIGYAALWQTPMLARCAQLIFGNEVKKKITAWRIG